MIPPVAMEPLLQVSLLTLKVSGSASALAAAFGLPMGAAFAIAPTRVRNLLSPVLTAFMGLPPVVVGLAVYVLLSREGPFGSLGLLYTPSAMIIAQSLLVLPIVAALTKEHVEGFLLTNGEQLRSMGASGLRLVITALFQVRFALTTVVLAGAGRAFAEVGAVFMVGGNIDGDTRVLTTMIATLTGTGQLSLALSFGTFLLCIVLGINIVAFAVRRYASARFGV